MDTRLTRILTGALSAVLLLWGGYTFLYYMGVPVHMAMLMESGQTQPILESCGESFLCRGWQSIWPSVGHALARGEYFFWFLMLSLVAWGAFVGYRYVMQGKMPEKITMSPWRIALLLLGIVWLLFTTISLSYGPYREIVEPLPQLYGDASSEGFLALQENFQSLQESDCLMLLGQNQQGAKVYNMNATCIQGSFFVRVLPHILLLSAIAFIFLVVGKTLLQLFRIKFEHLLQEAVFSVVLGACGVIVLLYLLALSHLYTANAGWLLLLALPIAMYRNSLYWGRRFINHTWEVPVQLGGLSLVVAFLLLTYIAVNFISVVRPFPIGWDDLGSYVNRPRLLVSYGAFIPTMATFQWEYITSLGFLLFGYDNILGSTAAMQLNFFAGVIAVFVVYGFVRTYLGKGGALAALLYYSLPLVGHFSFADMKVDNAVFFTGIVTLFAVFLYLFPPMQGTDEEDTSLTGNWKMILLAGVLAGFSFAMKQTGIMTVMSLGAMLLGVFLGASAFFGSVFMIISVYLLQGVLSVPDVFARITGQAADASALPFIIGCIVLGVGLLGLGFYLGRKKAKMSLIATGLFIGGFVVAIGPWMIVNNISRGNILPTSIDFSALNTLSTRMLIMHETPPDDQPYRALPEDLAIDPQHEACQATSRQEELDRYWGFGSGIDHYLLLPWRSVMNLDTAGYYVTTVPILLVFPALFLMPLFWRKKEGRWLRWLSWGTLLILLQWMFLANGVPWYAIAVFFGLIVGLTAIAVRGPDSVSRSIAGTMIGLSLFIAFGARLWQYENMRNLFEYPMGKVSAEAMQERTIPHYDDIRDIVLQRHEMMPERPFVFRMGTFIPYFIPKNLEIIPFADNQLEFFNCLNQEQDHTLTLQRLQALGFNSIIFDTNTHTIERNPNGTLHQKVNKLVSFLNNTSLGMRIVVNDPDRGVAFILLP